MALGHAHSAAHQFKRLNDTAGHPVGDRALRLFADSIRTTLCGRYDIVARLGGEEFAIVLPKAEEAPCRYRLSPKHGSTISELLASADRALYAAKAKGRDCAVLVGDLAPESDRRRGESTIRIVPAVSSVSGAEDVESPRRPRGSA